MPRILRLLCNCVAFFALPSLFPLVEGTAVICSRWPTANVQPQETLGNINRWGLQECDPASIGECDYSNASNCVYMGSTLVQCNAKRITLVGEASNRYNSCCPRGHSIAGWKIAYTLGNFVGFIEATCTDGTILPSWTYGFNGTDAAKCPTPLQNPWTIPNPSDGVYTYRPGFALEQFIVPNGYSHNAVESFKCKPEEVAVGFGARSNCVSIVDPKVFCVDRSELKPVSKSAGVSRVVPVYGQWPIVHFLIISGIILLAASVVTCLVVYVWLKRRSKKDWAEYTALSDGNELLERNASACPSHVELPSKGLRTVPFCEALADIDCIQVASIPVVPNKALALDSLPEDYQSWRIDPASLEIMYKNNGPTYLGSGGFGVVVLAMYCNAKAAVKILQGGSPSRDATFFHEINNLQEASKFTQIVQFFGYCAHRDKLCIVMEYMDRGDLFGRIKAKDENMHWLKRGLDIIQQIASGLSYLHSIGLAHLDLSSRNVLLNSRGQAKITDVAIGKLVESMHEEFTAPVIESAAWCAPERRRGRKCGLPSDIWSLGTILWEVCKMEPPSRTGHLSPLIVPKEAPQEVADIIDQCRASNPADRPTIGAFCNWLRTQQ